MKQLSPYVNSDQSADREPPLEGREINLREVISLISVHKKTVAVIAMCFLLVGLNYVLVRDRQFVASSRVLIDPIGIQVLDRDVLGRAESSDGNVAVVESQMRVMTSFSILKQVIAKENLMTDPEFLYGSSNIVFQAIGAIKSFLMPSGYLADPQVKVLFNLNKAVSANRPQRSYIVDLFVKTRDAKKSAHLANAIMRTYIESETKDRSSVARKASGTLSAHLAELRSELTEAEKAVERYKADKNILVDSSGSFINEQKLEQLNRLLVEAGARAALAQSHLKQIEAAKLSSADLNNIPEALSSTTISDLRISLTSALQNRSILSAGLLPSHPTMAAASAQISVVRQQIGQELSRIVGRAKVEVERIEKEQSHIEKQLDAIKRTTFLTNESRVRLRELTSEATAKRTVYESFLLRAKELGEQEGVDTMRARVISYALPPIRPSDLSSLLILALALFAGLITGILTVLIREFNPAAPERPVHFHDSIHQNSGH